LVSNKNKLEELNKLKEKVKSGPGKDQLEKRRAEDKLTARGRIELLLDKGSFEEIGMLVAEKYKDFSENNSQGVGVVTGFGTVGGKQIFVYAQDFTVHGGSVSVAHAEKIYNIIDLAAKVGSPVIGLNESGGARIQEGVASLGAYARVANKCLTNSGVIPQISAIMGPCAGGAGYIPAGTDFVFVVKGSYMYVTGPDVVKKVFGHESTHEELGGYEIHNTTSGVAHFASDSEYECMNSIKELLSYIPQNNLDDPPYVATDDPAERTDKELDDILPEQSNKPYDMKEIIRKITDEGVFFEVQACFAQNVIVGFARLDGLSVGIVASQPAVMAGALDIDSSDKIARFIRFCDCFNIPIITLVDVPGFLPGSAQEYGGIITHGAKIGYAYVEATVPKISLLIRKAYGGAYAVMGCKDFRGDINYAWPTAEIAVMGSEAAASTIFKKDIEASDNPVDRKKDVIADYEKKYANPYQAAAIGLIDDVFKPSLSRPKIIRALKMLQTKKVTNPPKKHGNIRL